MQITSGHRSYSGFLCGLRVFAGNLLPLKRKERKVLILAAIFLLAATNAFAQSNLDDLRYKISSGSVEDKRNALFELRSLHTAEASRIAIPALRDKNELVRASAVHAVVSLPKREPEDQIIPLLNDKAEFVRIEAAYTLGEDADLAIARGQPHNGPAVASLIRTLNHDKSIRVRSAAAVALGHWVNSSGMDALIAILKKKPREGDEYLRRSVARSIGQMVQIYKTGKPEIVTPQNFLPDKYKSNYRGPESPLVKWIPDNVNVLLKVLKDPNEAEDTRREAAFALGNINERSVIPVLRSFLESPDIYLAEICREALIKLDAKP